MNRTRFEVPKNFWRGFVASHWSRHPTLLTTPFAAPLFTAPEIFRSLVVAPPHSDDPSPAAQLRFFLQAKNRLEAAQASPRASDGSIEGFADRIERKHGRKFALVLNGLQIADPSSWMRMRDLLGGLYRVVGMPLRQTEAGVFLGNYESTPFGVHTDKSEIFCFIVSGRKRFRFWPAKALPKTFVHHRPNPKSYKPYKKAALTLEGGPGDVIYWPSNYWHVGESDGTLSLSVSVALEQKLDVAELLAALTHRCVLGRLSDLGMAGAVPFDPTRLKASARLPDVLQTGLEQCRGINAMVQEELERIWLNRVTGFGFRQVAPALPLAPLADTDVVRGDAEYPLLWRTRNGSTTCSGCGHSHRFATHPKLVALLERLNTGNPVEVGAQVKAIGRSLPEDRDGKNGASRVRTLLRNLVAMRAIVRSVA